MSKINLLSKNISNRISAGEVVEKPASIIKELVENSIDAGATKITIKIENGGCSKIIVIDDGCGILHEDVENAFLPHATSKIKSLEDLDKISTLGFRGEALASIATVSNVLILTKTNEEDLGSKLEINGGENKNLEYVSCNKGTEITVANVFYNTPARQKFLRKPKTEERDITDIVEKFLLSNPEISFKYIVDEKIIYNTTGSGLIDNIYTIYGKDVASNLIKIDVKFGEYSLFGYIGNPLIAKPNRTYQTLMINNRIVKNYMISNAISNAYSNFLMKNKFPFFVLNLNVPYENVDVNIHPSKQEVKFDNAHFIYDFFFKSVFNALNNTLHIQKIEDTHNNLENLEKDDTSKIKNEKIEILQKINDNEGNSFVNNSKLLSEQQSNLDKLTNNINFQFDVDENDKPFENISLPEYEIIVDKPFDEEKSKNINDKENFNKIQQEIINSSNLDIQNEIIDKKDVNNLTNKGKINLKTQESLLSNTILKQFPNNKSFSQQNILVQTSLNNKIPLKIIGTIFNTYIIIELENKIYIIDQHAAHERILFDKYKNQIKNEKLKLQDLMLSYVFNCSNDEYKFFEENLENLKNLGFIIEPFGYNKFKITAVPFLIYNINLNNFIDDLKSNIGCFHKNNVDFLKEFIAQQACKHAVKAGDVLSFNSIEKLVENLQNQESLLCPHGRPIIVEITKKQIEKWFKRIV